MRQKEVRFVKASKDSWLRM